MNTLRNYTLLKADDGEWIDDFFEDMIEYSKRTYSDVYGLFNGVLYVMFAGSDCPEVY